MLVESVQTPQSHASAPSARSAAWSLPPPNHGAPWLTNSPPYRDNSSLPPLDSEIPQRPAEPAQGTSASAIVVEPDNIQMEEEREVGPVHVGHQIWNQLGMNAILPHAALSPRTCRLSEVMTP